MITEKLLSELFAVKVTTNITISKAFDDFNGNELEWLEMCFNNISYPLDFIVYKCKILAMTIKNKHFKIHGIYSGANNLGTFYCGLNGGWYNNEGDFEADFNKRVFIGNTEYEAVFKACQWILDNKNTYNDLNERG